jgi:hypothetical protein
MTKSSYASCLLLLAALAAPSAQALDPSLKWYTLVGPHFTVAYHAGEEQLAQHMLDEAEASAARLGSWLDWQPQDKVQLVVTDHVDLPNGLTTSFPRDHVELYAEPPDEVNTLEDFDDWSRLLITHEYTHVLQLDKASGAPAFLRNVYGRNFILFPGLFQPIMLIEGLAVYDETDAGAGVGRGQSSLYSMYMRAEVARGVRPWSQVTMAGVTEWPGGTLPYLYGVNFYQFVDQTYGKAAIPRMVEDYSHDLIPFLVGWNLEQSLGDDVPELWPKFTQYLQQRYATPPYSAGSPLAEGERLTTDGFGTASPKAAGDGRVFYVRDDHHRQPTIMVWQAGKGSHELADTFTPARLDWNPRSGLLVARPDICDEYHYNFDLYRVDPETGDTTRLTHCGRYHYGAWSQDGTHILASHLELSVSSLVELDADGSNPRTLWTGEQDVILGGLDWSPDGVHVAAAVWRPGRRWALEEYSLDDGHWRVVASGIGVVADPEYAADGRTILFSSDAGGVYNLRRVDRVSGALTTLTRVATGAFSPSQGEPDGDIYYLGYTADGYDLYRLPAAGALAEALTPAPRDYTPIPPAPHVEGEVHDYSAWSGLLPAYWSPELFGAPDVVQLGAATSGQDALGVHVYAADANYEFTHHLTGGSLLYTYADRLQFLAARLYSIDADTSAQVLNRIRRQDRLQLLWQRPWPSLEHTLTFSLGAASDDGRDRYDSGTVDPPVRDAAAGIAFRWNSTHDWPISISHDDGRYVTFVAETSNALKNDYHGNAYWLDWNEYLRVGDEAVLTARWLEGYGTRGIQRFNLGGPTDPGYGTPAAQLLFDRRDFAFPGYPDGLTNLTGRRMRLASVGLRIPVWRPEAGFRLPPIGAHDFSLRFYYDIGGTWNRGGRPAHYSRSFGSEWVSDLSLFYLFNLRLVLGVAHGFDKGGDNQGYLCLELPLP